MFGEIWFILKNLGVNSPHSIAVFLFVCFFLGHIQRMKKHFVPNEVCFTSSSCRSGTRSGLLGDQQWPKAPSAPPGSLGFIRRGQSLGEPAHNGPNAVLATLLGLTGHWIHSPRALHAGSSLIYSSSNNWIPQPDQLVFKKNKKLR